MTENDLIHENYFGDGLDRPIYRILPIQHLVGDIEKKRMTMGRVIAWEDTHEAAFFRRAVRLPETGELVGLESLARDWFGQCWSTTPESDAMWRIYNANGRSVRLETTPRALMRTVFAGRTAKDPGFAPSAYNSMYVGDVTYQTESVFEQTMSTSVQSVLDPSGKALARMMLLKRVPFKHEAEVRFLYHAHVDSSEVSIRNADNELLSHQILEMHSINKQQEQLPKFIYLPFNWACITSVMIGPRVKRHTAKILENKVRRNLPHVPLLVSSLYGPPEYPGKF
jgi:hypothetical protein